ncbi:alpha/beta hydrolase family protein [Alteribacillus sp. HJP-4]|uniref:alpha/beta hydrolase family protein n=1 Tax=Alteribacillus sp. HJP-4 TaxID=2775394 RepID=UPI0035CD2BF1
MKIRKCYAKNRISIYEAAYKSGPFVVKGCLGVPEGISHAPGLLYLRGGIKHVGMVSEEFVIELCSRGFVVFAPYYRGNKGGHGSEDFAGEDREDALAGYDLLSELKQVQSQPIHVMGFSRGGVMALFTAMDRPVTSVVCWSGVSDMSLTYEERPDLRRMLRRVTGGTPANRKEEYEWRTPLFTINKLRAPVFIVHGEKDEHVSAAHAERLAEVLKQHEVPFEKKIYEGMPHHFPYSLKEKVLTEVVKWMNEQQ